MDIAQVLVQAHASNRNTLQIYVKKMLGEKRSPSTKNWLPRLGKAPEEMLISRRLKRQKESEMAMFNEARDRSVAVYLTNPSA